MMWRYHAKPIVYIAPKSITPPCRGIILRLDCRNTTLSNDNSRHNAVCSSEYDIVFVNSKPPSPLHSSATDLTAGPPSRLRTAADLSAASMAIPEELIDFEIIENSKENIQSLPGGRSAKALASLLSPMPSGRNAKSPTLDDTKNMNDAVRQEYEIELQSIADSDDPLDIYDRYVKWTLNAYPSAQATPQSQLLPLLERATKAFLTSSHYKNDPRYLKLWLHYIRLFSDAPRETFAFLARHNIGENLGLFYEEFAAWLENAGRWSQAEEVYKMGIEQEARPTERLMRKYHQFQQRFEARPRNPDEPSSPALPRVRAALATKIDPFAPTHAEDSQASARQNEAPRTTSRSTKPKMAIFSDAGDAETPPVSSTSKGWDSIGSMKERKKENTIEARPWVGETLKAGGRVGAASKMEIFKDPV